ncbi:hypothetical protein BCR35DRAFT_338793 [Leucosporidium creatinivorum]|uniref:MYND-type domain-containing protein n=1 Tax=Leucosporidium creatinivorum TaxID=106004 RepID=A0A1Y2FU52_9BASI|nr:hypothetical protein BCR35DRAFT_338793 [Leucosporidium creatinivorum]
MTDSSSSFDPEVVDCCSSCEKRLKKDSRLLCSGCRVAFYCSKECQVRDWSLHKSSCRAKQRGLRAFDETALSNPSTAYMVKDLDTYSEQITSYISLLAFRSAFHLGQTPDLTTSHVLLLDFDYDPAPDELRQRFSLVEGRAAPFAEVLARTSDPTTRADYVRAFKRAADRAADGGRSLTEEEKRWQYGMFQTSARNIKTGESCLMIEAGFSMDIKTYPVPFTEMDLNEQWSATLKRALSEPPRDVTELIILDWTESMGHKRTLQILSDLVSKYESGEVGNLVEKALLHPGGEFIRPQRRL